MKHAYIYIYIYNSITLAYSNVCVLENLKFKKISETHTFEKARLIG